MLGNFGVFLFLRSRKLTRFLTTCISKTSFKILTFSAFLYISETTQTIFFKVDIDTCININLDHHPTFLKCPGCKTPSEDHHWGIPSKFCEGFEKSSPKKEMETSPTSETVFSALAAELESLELEEEELRRQEEESKLRKRIADKRKLIERLRKSGSGDAAGEDNTPRLTTKDLPKVDFSDAEGRTPLERVKAAACSHLTSRRVRKCSSNPWRQRRVRNHC